MQVACTSHGGVPDVHSSMSLHVWPSPVKPSWQTQTAAPVSVLQSAFGSQPALLQPLVAAHVLPSPLYPELQVHRALPGVGSTHFAFASHVSMAQVIASLPDPP
jgi:hypothetical protein